MTTGGSVLQSPLIMPMLQQPYVPAHYAGHMTTYLLHNSEHFFPPLNAVCTLSNLIMTGTAYYFSGQSRLAAAKLPRLAIAAGLSVATTAYALGIMVPLNKRQVAHAQEMEKAAAAGEEKSEKYKTNERELRKLQNTWITMNYGRATIMICSALAGMSALLVK